MWQTTRKTVLRSSIGSQKRTKKGHAATTGTPLNPLFHKQKTDLHSQVGFMELMTGFEPVTSSLPKILNWRVGFDTRFLLSDAVSSSVSS